MVQLIDISFTNNKEEVRMSSASSSTTTSSQPPQYLCVFYLTTAGHSGQLLGSDEEEIVYMVYVLIDRAQNKVIGVQQYLVKPCVATTDENVGVLSPEVLMETHLTHDLVRKGLPLECTIKQFDAYVRSVQVDPYDMVLVTDGELPLRQCLHPEACTKEIELPEYYNRFIDLRKDFKAFYSSQEDMISIRQMIEYLRMNHDVENEFYSKEVKDMVNITQRLIADGYRFTDCESIMIHLEPGLCSKDEEVDPNCVVRARGLPWQSSDGDIAKFFRGLNIERGGVALCLSPQGRRNGEALVRFVNQTHRDMALKRHKHHMSNRYIEVYKATGDDFVNVAGGKNNEAHAFLSRGGQVIIRMRGLPYDCTAAQVLEFFRSGEQQCEVLDGDEGVLFVRKPDGRATGDAFVLFPHEEDAAKALSKHRDLIGSRYIELFRSTTAEVQQVLNRSMDPKTYEQQAPLLSQMPPQLPLLPQHIITSGTKKDCIRLRGLPYEAQVEHILEFLGDHAKNIIYQGVHMVYNAQGQPSGEAFIQMDSETSAFLAANNRHHRYMIFGKKQRYVEVFQCSGEDMNLVLTGGQVSPKAASMLSPGMLSPNSSLGVGVGVPYVNTSLPPPPPTPVLPSAAHAAAAAAAAYYEPHIPLIAPQSLALLQHNMLLNQYTLQHQQQQQQQHMMMKVPPPALPWPDVDPYGTLNNNLPQTKTAASPTPTTATTTTGQQTKTNSDTLAVVPVKQKQPEAPEAVQLPVPPPPPEYYAYPTAYPTAQPSVMFLPQTMPRVMQQVYKPAYPAAAMIPQVLTPMGMLGLKRSWDQAFTVDHTALQAAAKRWQPTVAASYPNQAAAAAAAAAVAAGFYPGV